MSEAKTIAEMQAELETLGYFLDSASNEWHWNGLYFGTIETAYAHLQRERQHEAMKALLEEMSNTIIFMRQSENAIVSEYDSKWADKARVILGK